VGVVSVVEEGRYTSVVEEGARPVSKPPGGNSCFVTVAERPPQPPVWRRWLRRAARPVSKPPAGNMVSRRSQSDLLNHRQTVAEQPPQPPAYGRSAIATTGDV
jgi:hypothetical protein